jgi:hypothetical protein
MLHVRKLLREVTELGNKVNSSVFFYSIFDDKVLLLQMSADGICLYFYLFRGKVQDYELSLKAGPVITVIHAAKVCTYCEKTTIIYKHSRSIYCGGNTKKKLMCNG